MLQGEHSAHHLTFIKLPFVINIFILSIFEWPLKTGFTVYLMSFRLHFKEKMEGLDCGDEIAKWASDFLQIQGIRVVRYMKGMRFRDIYNLEGKTWDTTAAPGDTVSEKDVSHKYYIPERMIVENIIPRNVIINQGAAEMIIIFRGMIFSTITLSGMSFILPTSSLYYYSFPLTMVREVPKATQCAMLIHNK